MGFSFPQRYVEAIRKLIIIDEPKRKAILDGISKIEASSSRTSLKGFIGDAFEDIPTKNEVLHFLTGLILDWDNSRESSKKVIDVVEKTVAKADFIKDDIELTKQIVQHVLNSPGFVSWVKVMNLSLEDERILQSARIITDIRPIFQPHVDEPPKEMIVVHNLRIAYSSFGQDVNEAYYNLRLEDLITLQDTIKRAIEKDAQIEASLKKGSVTVVRQ